MENLPPEILERIFENLTTVKDIGSCAQTCQNWQQVISSMYKNEKSKVMLATGTSQKHVEIIDLVNPKFQDTLQIKTPSRWGAVGGWIQNKPVIFGGSNGLMSRIKDGFFIRNKSPISKPIKMMEERYGASAVVLNDDTLWIVGGANGTQDLSSSEFVTLKGSTKGPFLPFTVYGHSMVKINDSTVYLIGGAQDSVTS